MPMACRRALGPDGRGQVLLRGARCPIVGTVTMDLTLVNAGDHPVVPGDVATLLGEDNGLTITLADLVAETGVQPRGLLTALGATVAEGLRMKRAAIIVLDGLGIGRAPDTEGYGDAGSDTLGNLAEAVGGLQLPNLERLGLGACRPLKGMSRPATAGAAYGVALPRSPGKDSTTGHWEICGVVLERPFRTYPEGFPQPLLDEFARRTGRGWLGNKTASGTGILAELGAEHRRTGKWIVYTSADSVFQVAAHEATVPIEELYRACGVARGMLTGEHAVSRVIARPFEGEVGDYRRTARRKDFSIEPVAETLLDRLAAAGVPRVGIGKVDDLFAGRNIASEHTPTNGDAYRLIERALDTLETGFVFVNVIEFDQTWGHRNDIRGFIWGSWSWMPGCRASRLACGRTICSFSRPTTATIPPRRPRIIHGKRCRCWCWAAACGRYRWASVPRSRTSGPPSRSTSPCRRSPRAGRF